MSLASMKTLGSTKQNADTRWMKEAVGPPWCHALRTTPLDRASTDGGSMAQALSWGKGKEERGRVANCGARYWRFVEIYKNIISLKANRITDDSVYYILCEHF